MAKINGKKLLIGAAAVGLAALVLVRRQSPLLELEGKVAFITGGSRGLGLLLARELGAQGCRIAICARDEMELAMAAGEIAREGVDVFTVRCDVGRREQVDLAIEAIRDHYGRIDILINNAGIIQVGPVEAMQIEDFEEAMRTMYWGTVYTSLAVLPEMRQRGEGVIMNITSIGAKVSIPHLLPYGAAKFAAIGFSEGLHAEVAKDGIRVTTVVPGLMRTGSFLNAHFKGDQKKEYAWFAIDSSLPLIAVEGRRAARRILNAVRRGRREYILSMPARLLALIHGLAPGMMSGILGAANRVLPENDDQQTGQRRGEEVRQRTDSRILDVLTTLGRRAARRYQ